MRRRRLAHFSLLSLFTLLPSLAVSQPLDQPVRIIFPFGREIRAILRESDCRETGHWAQPFGHRRKQDRSRWSYRGPGGEECGCGRNDTSDRSNRSYVGLSARVQATCL